MAELPQTDWSMLGQVAGDDDAQRDRALETIVRRYWPAIFAYIRRTGRDIHEAGDLTQGFIATVILQRNLINKADRSRGRFRSFLLTSLQNYLRERHRRDTRRRTATSGRRIAIDGYEVDEAGTGRFESPEAAFSYHWSAAIVQRVLSLVQQQCLRDGLEPHWQVFRERIAQPLLQGAAPPDLPTLVERHGLDNAAQVSNMIVTVKRRFARTLREEIRGTVNSEAELEEELAQLRRDLGAA